MVRLNPKTSGWGVVEKGEGVRCERLLKPDFASFAIVPHIDDPLRSVSACTHVLDDLAQAQASVSDSILDIGRNHRLEIINRRGGECHLCFSHALICDSNTQVLRQGCKADGRVGGHRKIKALHFVGVPAEQGLEKLQPTHRLAQFIQIIDEPMKSSHEEDQSGWPADTEVQPIVAQNVADLVRSIP